MKTEMDQIEQTPLQTDLLEIFADVFQMHLSPEIVDMRQQDCETWDSINHLRLIIELENAFQITIDDEDVPDLHSIRRVQAFLQSRGVLASPPSP